jgi:predicted transcriptional regulator
VDRSIKEKLISDIIMSPHRIDIMSSLSGQTQGLPFTRLVEKEGEIHSRTESSPELKNVIMHSLEKLIQENLITRADNNYFLTADGKEIFEIIYDVAEQAKKKSLI